MNDEQMEAELPRFWYRTVTAGTFIAKSKWTECSAPYYLPTLSSGCRYEISLTPPTCDEHFILDNRVYKCSLSSGHEQSILHRAFIEVSNGKVVVTWPHPER